MPELVISVARGSDTEEREEKLLITEDHPGSRDIIVIMILITSKRTQIETVSNNSPGEHRQYELWSCPTPLPTLFPLLQQQELSNTLNVLFIYSPCSVVLLVLPDSRSFLTQATCRFSQAKYNGVPRWQMFWSMSPPWAARDSMHSTWPAVQSGRRQLQH